MKIVKNSVLGKYILVDNKKGWERGCNLDVATKRNITEWVTQNTDYILKKIKELDDA